MTWMTTWQTGAGPAYAEHDSEHEAEAHARLMSATHDRVTVFEMDDEAATGHHAPTIAHRSDYRQEVAPGATDDLKGRQIEREGIER